MRPSADKTRNAIIAEATKLFLEHGFAGASMGKIAKQAGVNKSLIYHHFESKQNLWHQVKLGMFGEEFDEELTELLESKTDARSFIEGYVRIKTEKLVKYPDLVRLIQWQLLEPEPEALMSIPSVHKVLTERFVAYQKSGEVRADLSLEVMRILVMGGPAGYLMIAKALYPDFKNISKKQLDQLINEIVGMVADRLLVG